MGRNLAFSFLGSRDQNEVGTYTPLIIPSINTFDVPVGVKTLLLFCKLIENPLSSVKLYIF